MEYPMFNRKYIFKGWSSECDLLVYQSVTYVDMIPDQWPNFMALKNAGY